MKRTLVFAFFIISAIFSDVCSAERVLVQFRPVPVLFTGFTGFNGHEKTLRYLQTRNKSISDRIRRELFAGLQGEDLWIVQGMSTDLDAKAIQVLSRHPLVYQIVPLTAGARIIPGVPSLRETKKSSFTYGLEKIRLPEVIAKDASRDGRGIRVGILDTGIDANHPALQGKVLAFRDFIGRGTSPYDDHGHGTHVAGTIAGSPVNGETIGVAPGASLIVGKVFSEYGGSDSKQLLSSMQWIADPDGNPATNDGAQVVSNSWTADDEFKNGDPADQPFCQAVDNWVRLGIVPIFAAGNDGPNRGSVGMPGACPNAIAVGATDSADSIASFSSRGPGIWKTQMTNKPDIVAPGVDVESAQPGGGLVSKSGTSMAAPHVAGAVALLLQHLNGNPVQRVGFALNQGAIDLGAPGFDLTYGFGRMDLVRSIELIDKP